jgi:ankyrin repeat protein
MGSLFGKHSDEDTHINTEAYRNCGVDHAEIGDLGSRIEEKARILYDAVQSDVEHLARYVDMGAINSCDANIDEKSWRNYFDRWRALIPTKGKAEFTRDRKKLLSDIESLLVVHAPDTCEREKSELTRISELVKLKEMGPGEKLSEKLFTAVMTNDLESMKILLSRGADANYASSSGWTPLHQGSAGGHDESVELLISKGADVNSRTGTGWTPLHAASERGHKKIAEILISNNADIDSKENYGRTPLNVASRNGHKDVVELLISKGADINPKDNAGYTPLMYAAECGSVDMVKLLVSNSVNMNIMAKDGRTALKIALERGYRDTADLLRTNGARD